MPNPAPATDYNLTRAQQLTENWTCLTVPGNMDELTTFVEKLEPDAARATFSDMSHKLVSDIAEDIGAKPDAVVCPETSRGVKSRFFDVAARTADGKDLGRLAIALTHRQDVLGLAQAVARLGSRDSKVDFYRAMRDFQNQLDREDVGERVPGDIRPGHEGKASAAMGVLLAGMKDQPADVEKLLVEGKLMSTQRVVSAMLAPTEGVETLDGQALDGVFTAVTERSRHNLVAQCVLSFTASRALGLTKFAEPESKADAGYSAFTDPFPYGVRGVRNRLIAFEKSVDEAAEAARESSSLRGIDLVCVKAGLSLGMLQMAGVKD